MQSGGCCCRCLCTFAQIKKQRICVLFHFSAAAAISHMSANSFDMCVCVCVQIIKVYDFLFTPFEKRWFAFTGLRIYTSTENDCLRPNVLRSFVLYLCKLIRYLCSWFSSHSCLIQAEKCWTICLCFFIVVVVVVGILMIWFHFGSFIVCMLFWFVCIFMLFGSLILFLFVIFWSNQSIIQLVHVYFHCVKLIIYFTN